MARVHEYSGTNEKSFEVEGKIEELHHLNDSGVKEHLKSMGMPEEVMMEAMAAAQKIFNDKGILVSVTEMSVEAYTLEMIEKCRCGDRCVARECVPYERCWTERNGSRTCVSGHRQRCTRRVCNPC